MKVVDMIAYKREDLRKVYTQHLRKDGQVPSVVYGDKQVEHVSVPAILFRKILESDQAQFVRLNLEGKHIDCLLQDVQYHPISEHILHADFLVLKKKQIKMYVPIHIGGQAHGLLQGGKLQTKIRKVQLRAFPEDMPTSIKIDVSPLEVGQSIKVGELPRGKYKILEQPNLAVVSVQVPKALRSASSVEEESKEESKEETEEAATTEAT